MQAVAAGLFDQSSVTIQTAYMSTYGDTTLGLETKYVGDICAVKQLERGKAVFTVYDLLYRLSQPSPPNLYQGPCRHSLFNANCTLSVATFRVSGSVAAGSSNSLINLAAALGAIGNDPLPYTLGVLTWSTGSNAGLSATVRLQNSTTQLLLDIPTFLPVQTGDSFTLLPGCNKTTGACLGKFNNLINFGGMPFSPVPEAAL